LKVSTPLSGSDPGIRVAHPGLRELRIDVMPGFAWLIPGYGSYGAYTGRSLG